MICILICVSFEHFCEGCIPRQWSVVILSFNKGSSIQLWWLLLPGSIYVSGKIVLWLHFHFMLWVSTSMSVTTVFIVGGDEGWCGFVVTEVAGGKRSCAGLFFTVIGTSLASHLFTLIIPKSLNNNIATWSGFSEFWECPGGFACKQFCLLGWLRCLLVAGDRSRVIKLDSAVSNAGAQGLTEESGEALCASSNEIRFKSENCKSAYLGN